MKECPECKSTVNDEFDICPNCGYPFAAEELTKQPESTDAEEPQEPQEQPEITIPNSDRTRGKINKQLLIGIIIGGALVIALAVSVTKYNNMSGKFSEASKNWRRQRKITHL